MGHHRRRQQRTASCRCATANGATAWKTGLPLVRVPAGSNNTGTFGSGDGQWANKHAGSLFDLDPGKTYEIELTLTDPDGGSTTTTTTAATRADPGRGGQRHDQAGDPVDVRPALSAAAPGDILLLGAGSYPSFTVSRSGTADKPIVIRGESADTVIIGGRVTMNDRQWVYLENVTVQGEVRMHGASNMVVRGCKIRTTGNGINFQIGDEVPRNNYIVDNDVVGGATWVDDQLGADGYDGGEGIQFTGSGHVVCWNHVKGFRDNISLMEYDEAYEQVSIDICNNDIEEATDDGIEADSAMGNVRVMRNRIRNCFDGCSSQPNLGGPTYYIRNVMYNVLYSPFKFHNGTVGDVVFHNTVVKCGDGWGCYAGETWSRALFRNNLFIGGTGGGTYGGYGNGTGRVLDLGDADTHLLVRLRRPGLDRHRQVRGQDRRDPLHQRGDHAGEHHRGARRGGRHEHLRRRAGFPVEPLPAQADRGSAARRGQRRRRQGRGAAGHQRRLHRHRARSRRLRGRARRSGLRPAHRRRRPAPAAPAAAARAARRRWRQRSAPAAGRRRRQRGQWRAAGVSGVRGRRHAGGGGGGAPAEAARRRAAAAARARARQTPAARPAGAGGARRLSGAGAIRSRSPRRRGSGAQG